MFDSTRGRPGRYRDAAHPAGVDPRPAQLAGLRAEWRRLARRLADPDVELDADTVPAVLTCYHRLRAAGGVVDTMAGALIRQLGFQLADAEL